MENENEDLNKIKGDNIFIQRDHLFITWDEMNKLIDKVGEEKANDYVNSVLNYRKNTRYKSLYLTALKWIDRDAKTTSPDGLKRSNGKLAI
jgi:hypothetical protein